MNNTDVPLIVITGGPCGGKTTFLSSAQALLESHGIQAIVLSETATELISAGISPSELGMEEFQRHLLRYSLERENHYQSIAQSLSRTRRQVILCDRGLLDSIAYIDLETFKNILSESDLSLSEVRNRYRSVIHLVSAADGAEEYYTLANNTARSETPEEARALDVRTRQAWLGHNNHFAFIDNSTSFATKMCRALGALARVLDMPEPTEIERKFIVTNFTETMIPKDAVAVSIEQTYLNPVSEKETRRVRQWTAHGVTTYFYTEKVPTGESGTCIEREDRITKEEYNRLLLQRNPAGRTNTEGATLFYLRETSF